MKLLLTRHGQSLWQTLGKRRDRCALKPLGSGAGASPGRIPRQVRKPPARISASPLLRARQTAGAVARYLDAPVTCDNDLREFETGCRADPPSPVDMWRTMAAALPSPTAFHRTGAGAAEQTIGAASTRRGRAGERTAAPSARCCGCCWILPCASGLQHGAPAALDG